MAQTPIPEPDEYGTNIILPGSRIVTGSIPISKLDQATQDAINTPSGGGGGTYTVVASGVVENGVDAGSIFTGTPGKDYIIVAACSPSGGGSNMTVGDEDNIDLRGVTTIEVVIESTIPGPPYFKGVKIEYISASVGSVASAQAYSDGIGFPGADHMLVSMVAAGSITAAHNDAGSSSNGAYVVYEK